MTMNNSANNSKEGSEMQSRCSVCWDIISIMDTVVMPVVFALGILGNILAIVVVLLTKLRRHPPSTYLITLAISDTVFLFDQFLLLHQACHYSGMCQICIFLQYFAPFCSGWLLVGFTFERFIVVVYPIRQLQWGSWRATRVFIICVVIGGTILSAPLLYVAALQKQGDGSYICGSRNTTLVTKATELLLYSEASVTFFVPFIAITVLNCFIIRAVRRSVRLQASRETAAVLRTQRSNGIQKSGVATTMVKSQRNKREQTSAAITRILILVSTMFVLTNFPTYFLRIYAKRRHRDEQLMLALLISEYPYQLNFTLNFLLYSFSSSTFRGALCKLCCRCWGGAVPTHLRSTGSQGQGPGLTSHSPRPSNIQMEMYRQGGAANSNSYSYSEMRPFESPNTCRYLTPDG